MHNWSPIRRTDRNADQVAAVIAIGGDTQSMVLPGNDHAAGLWIDHPHLGSAAFKIRSSLLFEFLAGVAAGSDLNRNHRRSLKPIILDRLIRPAYADIRYQPTARS